MKNLTKVLVSLLLIAGMSACSSTKTQTTEETNDLSIAFVPGTYNGTGVGHGGNISVEVTLSEDEIKDIIVTESNETSGFGNVAAEHIISDILENQSLNVDSVSGCTLSANGIKTAVENALESAGVDVKTLKEMKKAPVERKDTTIDTDVVIIGSGAAGLTAAYEAANAGAKVVILEKQARTGGATRMSSGMIVAGGTSLQEEAGIEDSVENLKEYWLERGEGNVDESQVEYVAENINDALDLFLDLGITYTPELILQSGTATINRAHMPAGAGAEFCDVFEKTLLEMGVEILTETTATNLITNENNEVIGVNAEDKLGSITVNARSVVIATGGFGWNNDMLEEYSPNAVGAWSCSSPGNTGDGIAMGLEVGADTVFKGGFIGWKVCTPLYDHTTAVGAPVYGVPNLIVNEVGERVGNESLDYPFIYNQWIEDGSKDFYYIFQSSNGDTTDLTNNVSDTVANLELGVEAGVVFKGETIEELATNSGLTNLSTTIETFNKAIEAGVDEEFGRDTNTMITIEDGPFYAIHAQRATLGTFGGLKTNITGEVVDTNGNEIIGLYAAGEVANGDFFPVIYPASGSSISQCVVLGREAGMSAANFALN